MGKERAKTARFFYPRMTQMEKKKPGKHRQVGILLLIAAIFVVNSALLLASR